MQNKHIALLLGSAAIVATGCGGEPPPVEITPGLHAFVGATLIDGTGGPVMEDAVLIVRDGRIEATGTRVDVEIPADAEQIDVTGRTIIPGLINAHGHVNNVRGLESSPDFYTEEHVENQLGLYARYGVTTVFSLGGDGPEGMAVRDRQNSSDLDRARLYVAGDIVVGPSPEEAREQVNAVATSGADVVKIRVDDNLGSTTKMTEETYQAVISSSHEQNLDLTAHMYYLEDAKGLLEAGADLLAHSVRDTAVDDELIALLRSSGACYSPTLMREVSTYVYETRPEWFDDQFFLKEADPTVVAALEASDYQERLQNSQSAQTYKAQLEVAKQNLKALSDAGIPIAMGTDTGPTGRFQGYFEHGELALMVEAGLTPMQAIVASTSDAANCMDVGTDLGSLEAGKWADFLVLEANPLENIANTQSLESVYIAGNTVPGV
ncbi:MAG: amidohydrolase [Acidobacteria bacterium]|nr:amidohydrolase [Acidobacteriota bacterium]|tara:strand:+ start:2084 stop:3391 length:1308 start_codon:yes stop_codon:yes gene_type:complete